MSLTFEEIDSRIHDRSEAALAMTRALDVTLSAIGLVCASPAFLLIAAAIKLDGAGPVFYRQTRIGKGFVPFQLYKFRTMRPGSDRAGSITCAGDDRVTRIGRLLRKYKLDELPQLWNVLRGDMQLVGSRPEVARFVEMFRTEYTVLLHERPGVTDPASLAFRREQEMLSSPDVERQYVMQVLPQKLELSVRYQQHRTIGSDFLVLLRTALSLISL